MNNKKDLEFERISSELEDPKNAGIGSWSLPVNPTPVEKIKYEICQKLIRYQRENSLSDELLSRKLHLTIEETRDILFCRLSKFNLDNFLNHTKISSYKRVANSKARKESYDFTEGSIEDGIE
ncbi:MAG: hypothetical protein AM1032_000119 [Mycoplasmataceae bacterium]|nr:MAG: hypothetical protein AM1032_000119 [Mycoplasmataceae bacterium]